MFKTIIRAYYIFANIYISTEHFARTTLTSLKTWVFHDDEIVYKAYLSPRKGVVVLYNHETLFYLIYACILKLLNIKVLRCIESVDDLIYVTSTLHVFTYYRDGILHGEIAHPEYTNTDNAAHRPMHKLAYAVVNDKYNVTKEYNLFKTSLEKLNIDILTTNLMDILMAYKYRNFPRFGPYNKFTCFNTNTFEEYLFKSDDVFIIKDGPGPSVPE
jgi:hypothetical protein